MPTVLREGGFRVFFFSNESEEPPHVHIERAESGAKFWLQPEVRLAWSVRFRQRDVTRMRKLIESNQTFLLERWDEYFPS
jgi:hypothetical protein